MLKSFWQNWANKRFRFEHSKKLSQKDILVFIYQQGYLYLVLILLTFVAGINYANNLILGFCFLISAVLCISFYLTFKQLHGLEVEISTNEVGQAGQNVDVTIYLHQTEKYNRYLWIATDSYEKKILLNQVKDKVILSLYADTRGRLYLPKIKIMSVYPFGLVRAWTYLYPDNFIWIAPKSEHYQSESKQLQRSFEQDVDEFRELRDFQDGDSLQAVSWKQAARGQGLYIKVFEQHEDQHSMNIVYENMPANSHENKLSLMMGLVEQCEQVSCAYSLSLPKAQLEKGCGEQHLLNAKLLLAQA